MNFGQRLLTEFIGAPDLAITCIEGMFDEVLMGLIVEKKMVLAPHHGKKKPSPNWKAKMILAPKVLH